MISITITGSAAEVREEMHQLLNGERATAPVADKASATAADRPARTRKAVEPKEVPKEVPGEQSLGAGEVADQLSADSPQAASPSTAPDAPASIEATTESLKERALKYSQKAGPQALVELQKLAGAEVGKFSEIDGNPERMNKMGALLADMGF